MAIIQPSLEIPPQFQNLLDSGELWRDGGVLRRVKDGTIALLLKDGPIPEKTETATNRTLLKASQRMNVSAFLKDHKVVVISGVIVLCAFIGTGIYIYVRKKKREKAIEAEENQNALAFQTALIRYLKAATIGQLTAEIVEYLISALDNLENSSSQSQIQVEFAHEDVQNLVDCILKHTSTLASAYNYELDDLCSEASHTTINLRNHLKTQKNIFELVS